MVSSEIRELAGRRCEPCRAGTPPVAAGEVARRLVGLPGWTATQDGKGLTRRYRFRDFAAALSFVNRVAASAEEQDHHPDVEFGWGYARITWTTHAIRGVSENDFIMAARTDVLFEGAT